MACHQTYPQMKMNPLLMKTAHHHSFPIWGKQQQHRVMKSAKSMAELCEQIQSLGQCEANIKSGGGGWISFKLSDPIVKLLFSKTSQFQGNWNNLRWSNIDTKLLKFCFHIFELGGNRGAGITDYWVPECGKHGEFQRTMLFQQCAIAFKERSRLF